jgi:hypothetical protein
MVKAELQKQYNRLIDMYSKLNSEQLFFLYLGIIYVIFILFDLFQIAPHLSAALKYAGIAICLAYVLNKYRNDHNLIAALFFTVIADTILVWTHYEVAGVIIFCLAQFFHAKRIHNLRTIYFFGFLIFLAIIMVVAYLYNFVPIYTVATLYAFLLVFNLISAIMYRKNHQSKAAIYLKYGFITFVACDICVALRHVIMDGLALDLILPIVSFLVWIFYLPSQALLSHSSLPVTRLQKNIISDKLKS